MLYNRVDCPCRIRFACLSTISSVASVELFLSTDTVTVRQHEKSFPEWTPPGATCSR